MRGKLSILVMAALTIISCQSKTADDRIVLGDERFEEYLPLLEGKRVAVYSNHTGIVGDKSEGLMVPAGTPVTDENCMIPFGTPASEDAEVVYGPHILDALIERGVNVTAIFSPEHGFRGAADAGANVPSSVDPVTGIPILSLYEHGTHLPSAESMAAFDVIVVDIQDVGMRYYTYYITMHHLMEASAKYGKKVVVLDRPNPNGFYVDGPMLDMKYKSGIGWLPICMIHGMTLGELALMINGEGWIPEGTCDLTVIPCLNYDHQMKYSLLMKPSPNLKDMKSVYLYAENCYFAATIVTEGRGTMYPYELCGHPDMKGVEFSFTPRSMEGASSPRYQDQLCYGFDFRDMPLQAIWDRGADFTNLINAYNQMNVGEDFFTNGEHFEHEVGQGYVREMILAGASADEIKAMWTDDVKAFKEQRRPYLLYAE
ncbi:MAG: DUF1343 domain-containing protein [Bacteroidales bacterium]|nr:DUF1343 domain-containing protein [Bacteroidales bacterium]